MDRATEFQNLASADQPARVSVVVPSYNHGRFVESTLRSIFKQTFVPAKLLVIDDGSTDDSPRTIERVLHDCPLPCELIVRPNRGLCATLNQGLRNTSGEYLHIWVPTIFGSRNFWRRAWLCYRRGRKQRSRTGMRF